MSHNSPRSLRIKSDAKHRPDAVWSDTDGMHQEKFDNYAQTKTVLSGGSELSKLINESDLHLAAMRKIVQ